MVVPAGTRLDVVRAFAISKLAWIHEQRKKYQDQPRETKRSFIERESHYLWGRRYLLSIVEKDEKPEVVLDHHKIILKIRPNSSVEKREEIMHEWHKRLLHNAVRPLIAKWEVILDVKVASYFLQRMKTKWGACNHGDRHIRLNTELVKKPKDLLEYVIVHEMTHLLEPTHSERFHELLDMHYPGWREARSELNELPLAAEAWEELHQEPYNTGKLSRSLEV